MSYRYSCSRMTRISPGERYGGSSSYSISFSLSMVLIYLVRQRLCTGPGSFCHSSSSSSSTMNSLLWAMSATSASLMYWRHAMRTASGSRIPSSIISRSWLVTLRVRLMVLSYPVEG